MNYHYLQDRMTSLAHALTQRSTRPDRLQHFLRAHGHVDAAEEKPESLGATALNQRRERLQLQFGVLLQLVADEIGHAGDVVAQPAAHVDFNRIAFAHFGARKWELVWINLSRGDAAERRRRRNHETSEEEREEDDGERRKR